MRIGRAWGWFAGFTAVFAALAAYVFWGTWSLDVVPVMPDATTTYPADQVARSFRGLVCFRHFTEELSNLIEITLVLCREFFQPFGKRSIC